MRAFTVDYCGCRVTAKAGLVGILVREACGLEVGSQTAPLGSCRRFYYSNRQRVYMKTGHLSSFRSTTPQSVRPLNLLLSHLLRCALAFLYSVLMCVWMRPIIVVLVSSVVVYVVVTAKWLPVCCGVLLPSCVHLYWLGRLCRGGYVWALCVSNMCIWIP